jgi:quinol monooxygenase YgiN
MHSMRLIRRCCVLAACLLVVPASLPAQTGNIRTILFCRVKADRKGDWSAAVKEYAALMKKSGSAHGFTVWEAETGPDQYAVVWYSAKWKDVDEIDDPKNAAGEIARVIARANGAMLSTETWMDELQTDLLIAGKEPPKMVRTAQIRVSPGRVDEVLAALKTDALPALRKSGVSDWGVAIARYGTPANEIHIYSAVSGWAELDGPTNLQKEMTAGEYKAYEAKLRPYLEMVEWTMWRYQPELSYIPAPKQ